MKKTLFLFAATLFATTGFAQKARYNQRTILSDSLSSNDDETALVISADGKRMYFVRSFHADNTGGTAGMQDIYYTEKNADGTWTKAYNLGAPINDEFHNAVCGVTRDGTRLFLNAAKIRQDKTVPGIAISNYDNGEWSMPVSINAYPFPEKGFFQAFVAYDENTAIVSFQGPDSRGLEDLYFMKKDETGFFNNPVSLGNTINTTGFETAPILSADGKTLYFTSNGHPGKGDGDIFKSMRLDESWTNWSAPENLGPVVNTNGYDGSYCLDGAGNAYFISGESNDAPGDIYVVGLIPPPAVDPKADSIAKAAAALAASGTNSTANGNLANYGNGGTDQDGTGKTTGTNAGATGSGTSRNGKNGQGQAGAQPSRTDTLDQALFEFNSFVINTSSKESLQNVVKRLLRNPKYRVQVEGHTDSKGSEGYNQRLSEQRARSVRKFLIRQGIAGARIKTQGFGELNPIADNETEEGRAMNRRVEVKYYLRP